MPLLFFQLWLLVNRSLFKSLFQKVKQPTAPNEELVYACAVKHLDKYKKKILILSPSGYLFLSCRPMHEITFASNDRPKGLTQVRLYHKIDILLPCIICIFICLSYYLRFGGYLMLTVSSCLSCLHF
jgi:hypothetical protein